MNAFTDVETETLLSGESDWIGPAAASRLAHHPVAGIETEFPHHGHRIDAPGEVERPSERHPVFFGCYDWHSAVHSHWALVRQLRLFPDHPDRAEVVRRIDARLTPENVEREVERFEENSAFEKPYGWAWLLHLAAELSLWEDERADAWAETLAPLESKLLELVESEFLSSERPFRVGTHGNSAFALHCLLDYARTTDHDALAAAVTDTALAFYADDRDYPVGYEPLGWDFLSPALTEADLMRRVYDRETFAGWLDGFLPDLRTSPHDAILDPVGVDTATDEGVALHLVGLNVSKAWALAGLASTLDDHRDADLFRESAGRHAERGLSQAFTDDYAGSHWLSSFVLYLLTRNEGGIAPA